MAEINRGDPITTEPSTGIILQVGGKPVAFVERLWGVGGG